MTNEGKILPLLETLAHRERVLKEETSLLKVSVKAISQRLDNLQQHAQ